MNFREFLYKEDPDILGGYASNPDVDAPAFGDNNSLTFALFNNFYLYSDYAPTTHGDLFNLYCQKIFRNRDLKLQTFGEISEENKDKLKEIYIRGNIDRTPMLNAMPWVIQGRLWKDNKIISFWNDLAYLARFKNNILDFMNKIGENPSEYQYEINNVLNTYNDFFFSHYKTGKDMDVGKLHTLSPEDKKQALRDIGAVPKAPRPMDFMRSIRQESFVADLDYYAQISDKALDSAYGYGLSKPGTFGSEANRGSAEFALQLLNKGIIDIEKLANAIHDGWSTIAKTYQDPIYISKPEKRASRLELANKRYNELPEAEKEKDRVVARALLDAYKKGRN
jgi:hypothetical protein